MSADVLVIYGKTQVSFTRGCIHDNLNNTFENIHLCHVW